MFLTYYVPMRLSNFKELPLKLGMSLSLTKFKYLNIEEFSLVTQTRTLEIDLFNEISDLV